MENQNSLLNEITSGKGDKDLEDMHEQMTLMLTQMRFANGDTLADRLEEMRMKKKIKEEEERLANQQNSASSSSSSDGEDDLGTFSSGSEDEKTKQEEEETEELTESIESSNDDSFLNDSGSEKEEDDQEELIKEKADQNYLNNIVHAKKGLKDNKEAFLASISPDVSAEEREKLIRQFDSQMGNLEK